MMKSRTADRSLPGRSNRRFASAVAGRLQRAGLRRPFLLSWFSWSRWLACDARADWEQLKVAHGDVLRRGRRRAAPGRNAIRAD